MPRVDDRSRAVARLSEAFDLVGAEESLSVELDDSASVVETEQTSRGGRR